MQKILFILLISVLFTGCIERGQQLKPIALPKSIPTHITPIKIKQTPAVSKVKPVYVEKVLKILTPSLASKACTKNNNKTETFVKHNLPVQKPLISKKDISDESIFPLSEETKNKISGFFILVIGIIILL